MSDPLMERLAALPGAESDASRSARTRDQCAARLSARRPSRDSRPAPRRDRLWAPAIAILGALYMIEALVAALRVYSKG